MKTLRFQIQNYRFRLGRGNVWCTVLEQICRVNNWT